MPESGPGRSTCTWRSGEDSRTHEAARTVDIRSRTLERDIARLGFWTDWRLSSEQVGPNLNLQLVVLLVCPALQRFRKTDLLAPLHPWRNNLSVFT